MSLKNLPAPKALERPAGYAGDAPADALGRWSDRPLAAEADNPGTISIYDVIGADPWTGEGITAKRIAGILRSIGKAPVTVNVNSPGGDMFEGLAIYNLLREHPEKVTVKVMGLAASAASLIAMAGDDVLMGSGSVMMIHRAWGLVIGNRHDFADAAEVFDTFDQSMASIYAARTGKAEAEVIGMLDGPARASDGTWMTAAEAVAQGFADGEFDSGSPEGAGAKAGLPADVVALRRVEAALARQGVGRRERGDLIKTISGPREAPRTSAREAGDTVAAFERLLSSIRS